MPLILDQQEVLPVGIHDATVEELEEVFGRWTRCDRRPDLFKLFKEYIAAVRRTGWDCAVIVDGSFVMLRVDDPDDIDVILGHPPEITGLVESDSLRPYQLNVLDPTYCKRTYKIDLKPCTVGGDKFDYWVDFFSQVSTKRADKHGLPTGSRKGIVRVKL